MTLRELMWMAEGRIRHADEMLWNHTASILAMLYNTNRSQKKRAIKPDAFLPRRRGEKSPGSASVPLSDVIAVMKTLPTDQRKGLECPLAALT